MVDYGILRKIWKVRFVIYGTLNTAVEYVENYKITGKRNDLCNINLKVLRFPVKSVSTHV